MYSVNGTDHIRCTDGEDDAAFVVRQHPGHRADYDGELSLRNQALSESDNESTTSINVVEEYQEENAVEEDQEDNAEDASPQLPPSVIIDSTSKRIVNLQAYRHTFNVQV